MIEAQGLTKRYGTTLAVDQLSFRVEPGVVTGFLGPNGAGKSTTMRMMLGLDRPTAGTVTIAGRPYRELDRPLRTVGALLDASAVHPGRSAYAHLLALARSNGIARTRVGEELDRVGLAGVAARRPRTFSLGMRQRLGLARRPRSLGRRRHAGCRRTAARADRSECRCPASEPLLSRHAQGRDNGGGTAAWA